MDSVEEVNNSLELVWTDDVNDSVDNLSELDGSITTTTCTLNKCTAYPTTISTISVITLKTASVPHPKTPAQPSTLITSSKSESMTKTSSSSFTTTSCAGETCPTTLETLVTLTSSTESIVSSGLSSEYPSVQLQTVSTSAAVPSNNVIPSASEFVGAAGACTPNTIAALMMGVIVFII